MRQSDFRINKFVFICFTSILISSLLANLFILPVFADDAGFALRFDGTSDFVELQQTDTIFAAGWETGKSVALWVKPDGLQATCDIVADLDDVAVCPQIFSDRPKWWGIAIGHLPGPNQNRIWVWNHDGSDGSPNDFVGVEYTPGEWVHITLVHNNGMLRAFKNGVEVGSTPSGPTQQPVVGDPVLHIGGVIVDPTHKYLFQGDIDEVSLWNRALPAAEISANMYQDAPTSTTDLAAFYRMTPGSGTSLEDNSGSGHTGTLFGPPEWVNSTAFNVDGPAVTINKAVSQPDPTMLSPINFTVVFAEAVTDFTTGDVTLTGSAFSSSAVRTGIVTGSGTTYNVAVSGMTNSGAVTASINTGVAHNLIGQPNQPSTSTYPTVQFNVSGDGPTVTINLASGQAATTSISPINFQVIFSQAVTGFTTGDVSLSGTADATTAIVTGSGTTYNVAVSGMRRGGTVIITIPPGVAQAATPPNNPNQASVGGDNTVTYQDLTGPTVTINQAPGQRDPAPTLPVFFQVIFSEPVDDFGTTDVNLTGTTATGPRIVAVNGSGTTYDVAVSGLTGQGLIMASINAGSVHDGTGNPNSASTSTDNSVLFINASFSIYLPLTIR
jgi:Concanavalin A-like lectin/glucanases superfamily